MFKNLFAVCRNLLVSYIGLPSSDNFGPCEHLGLVEIQSAQFDETESMTCISLRRFRVEDGFCLDEFPNGCDFVALLRYEDFRSENIRIVLGAERRSRWEMCPTFSGPARRLP